jgi:hypothetical protein
MGVFQRPPAVGSIANIDKAVFPVTIGDGSTVLTTGAKKIYEKIPYSGAITKVTLQADQVGDVVVDIWKKTYGAAVPTVADTITASAKPTLSSQSTSQDSTLTGWTTAVTAEDVFEINVDSVGTITKLTISLDIDKSVF